MHPHGTKLLGWSRERKILHQSRWRCMDHRIRCSPKGYSQANRLAPRPWAA